MLTNYLKISDSRLEDEIPFVLVFYKNLLKKIDWWPFSNVGTSTGLSERVRCTRLKKFVLCLLQEAANWFLGLANVWHACSTYLLCQYYCKVASQIFSDFFLEKSGFQIQDLPFRKAVMFHQSWGKLKPFFSLLH